MTMTKKRKSPASRKMKRMTTRTRKRSDNSRLSLHPRIFFDFRVILQVVSRNAGHLALKPPPNSAASFSFSAAGAEKNRNP
jgi:hypothetical protein